MATFVIDDAVMERLRQEAARTGRTMSDLVEDALCRLLDAPTAAKAARPLPTFASGGSFVDVADRDALCRAMEGR